MKKLLSFLSIALMLFVVSGFLGSVGIAAYMVVTHEFFKFLIIPIFLGLLAIPVYDVLQKKHALLRNFPLFAHTRWIAEWARPKITQYTEREQDGAPFSREMRAVVYQRAKDQLDTVPFGTKTDQYEPGIEFLTHSAYSVDPETVKPLQILVGGRDCTQKYMSSLVNTSAMSFGALGTRAVLAIGGGAKMGGFAQNTGEGGLTDHHLKNGNDIVWQIGTGYFGCRTKDGKFDDEKFVQNATRPQVKMIELKISQGAKPGHGGILPGAKVTEEISRIRGVEAGKDCVSPPYHTAFTDAESLILFIDHMRRLSGGKPVGFKLCVGRRSELHDLVAAMVKLGKTPDFITVDGAEGGTGAAPLEHTNNVGFPLKEGLAYLHHLLQQAGIRQEVKIFASGKMITAFDIVKTKALGADGINIARGFLFSLGCIQALSCNTGKCPTGITTNDKTLQEGLVVQDKEIRVRNFHHHTLKAVKDLIASAGLDDISKLDGSYIMKRMEDGNIRSYSEIYAPDRDILPPLSMLQVGERAEVVQ